MRLRLAVLSSLVSVGLVFAAAFVFEWPVEKAATLAPVIVMFVGAAMALVVLWTRIALESLRRARHPRRIVALGLAGVGLIVLLTVLGVELPRE